MSKVKVANNGNDKTYYIFCPACKTIHPFGEAWGFNGDVGNPTLEGSLGHHSEQGYCHGFISNGKITFGADSTHAMAGQTVELPDFPEELAKQIDDAG